MAVVGPVCMARGGWVDFGWLPCPLFWIGNSPMAAQTKVLMLQDASCQVLVAPRLQLSRLPGLCCVRLVEHSG